MTPPGAPGAATGRGATAAGATGARGATAAGATGVIVRAETVGVALLATLVTGAPVRGKLYPGITP